MRLMAILLELPLAVVKRADLASLEPARDAVKVKGMITDTPSNSAFLTGCRCLVGLTLNAVIHNVISADSTVVNNYIPCPQGDSIPLFYFESLSAGARFV